MQIVNSFHFKCIITDKFSLPGLFLALACLWQMIQTARRFCVFVQYVMRKRNLQTKLKVSGCRLQFYGVLTDKKSPWFLILPYNVVK